jgi:CheY-specific phosphatase CheX
VSDSLIDEGICESVVTSIMTDVIMTMTGSTVTGPAPRPPDGIQTVTAAVYFVGDWKGAVLLQCPPALCYRLTSQMLSTPLPTEVDDDVRDAMGELCNMVAGNLKSVMLHRAELSLPSIVEGDHYTLRVCGNSVMAGWSYEVDGLPCVVSVIQTDA